MSLRVVHRLWSGIIVVGKAGFEPATSASRTLRANQAALLPGAGWSTPTAHIVVSARGVGTRAET